MHLQNEHRRSPRAPTPPCRPHRPSLLQHPRQSPTKPRHTMSPFIATASTSISYKTMAHHVSLHCYSIHVNLLQNHGTPCLPSLLQHPCQSPTKPWHTMSPFIATASTSISYKTSSLNHPSQSSTEPRYTMPQFIRVNLIYKTMAHHGPT